MHTHHRINSRPWARWLFCALTVLACGCGHYDEMRGAFARETRCAESDVVVVDLPKPNRGRAWLAFGCDHKRRCLYDSDQGKWVCRWDEDLKMAVARLKLLTNCPGGDMVPLAYDESGRKPTADDERRVWSSEGGAYRISACGAHYICTIGESGANCDPAASLGHALVPAREAPPSPQAAAADVRARWDEEGSKSSARPETAFDVIELTDGTKLQGELKGTREEGYLFKPQWGTTELYMFSRVKDLHRATRGPETAGGSARSASTAAPSTPAARPPQPTRSAEPAAPRCTSSQIEGMRAMRLSEESIRKACFDP
jgi:hypothetical protein